MSGVTLLKVTLGVTWTQPIYIYIYIYAKVTSPNNYLLKSYFENLIIKLQALYVLNMHFENHVDQILFTIWSINTFFMQNYKLQKLEI